MYYDGFYLNGREYMYSFCEYGLVCPTTGFISREIFPLLEYMNLFGECCPVCRLTGFISSEIFPSGRIHNSFCDYYHGFV